MVIAFSLFGALIGFAADRWVVTNGLGNPPAGAATPSPIATGPRIGPVAAADGAAAAAPAPTATPGAAADPAQQAIQQVIQRGDEEQAQAFAANDTSLMADTATSDFYQQQVQIDHDLRSNGVSDIKLVTIDWGAIAVSGNNATATAFETWSTTYSDGSTEQSRDRNVYTLVQDNGAWKVSADDHPDDAVGVGTGGAPGATSPGGQGSGNPGRGRGTPAPSGQPPPSQPRVPRSQDTSQNWSGYSATGGTFTSVTGTWNVPEFTADSPTGADATWVGIGGVDSRDLIQAGTQQTVTRTGATHYEAWVETLPQASHPVPLTINPGDSVTVSVTLQPQGQDQWQISFKNETTGQTYQVTEHYASSMSSAEWIEEAPSAGRGRQIPLDNFGTVTFSHAAATKDGKNVSVSEARGQAITMVGRGGQQLTKPSPVGADGASFSVTRG